MKECMVRAKALPLSPHSIPASQSNTGKGSLVGSSGTPPLEPCKSEDEADSYEDP